MNLPLRCLALFYCILLAGCGHLEVTPEGDPNRVITGTVNLRMPVDLPGDATVLVRVVDGARAEPTFRVLGEQTIAQAGKTPVPFRVEFRADDVMLRHGLNIEARISFGGRLRYSNFNAVAFGPNSFDRPLVVVVDPVKR